MTPSDDRKAVTDMVGGFTRRGFIMGLALLGVPAATTPAGASPRPPITGWPDVDGDSVGSFRVEGSPASATLLRGDVAVLLTHVLRRFHYEVLALGPDSVVGHSTNRSAVWSTHRSGTAVVIRPDRYPPGVTGGFDIGEVAIIRDVLADCEGTVRWGADDPGARHEGRFRIDVPPGHPALARVADALRAGRRTTGTRPDPFTAARLHRATALAHRQRPR